MGCVQSARNHCVIYQLHPCFIVSLLVYPVFQVLYFQFQVLYFQLIVRFCNCTAGSLLSLSFVPDVWSLYLEVRMQTQRILTVCPPTDLDHVKWEWNWNMVSDSDFAHTCITFLRSFIPSQSCRDDSCTHWNTCIVILTRPTMKMQQTFIYFCPWWWQCVQSPGLSSQFSRLTVKSFATM